MGDIEISQLIPFRVEKASGLFLNLRHGFAYTYTGWQVLPDQEIDLTDHVPNAGARVVLICISSIGEIHLTDGAARSDKSLITVRDTPDVPEHEIPLAAVVLEAGQTEIVHQSDMTDIADLRNFLLPPMGSYAHEDTELALTDLTDVTSGSPGGGEALYWNESTGLWDTKQVLEFSGLSKITVSSGSPAGPSNGDLWIDIS